MAPILPGGDELMNVFDKHATFLRHKMSHPMWDLHPQHAEVEEKETGGVKPFLIK